MISEKGISPCTIKLLSSNTAKKTKNIRTSQVLAAD